MEQQTRKYIFNHVSPETSYLVEDYPWGFRLRTQIRYWIESKKNFGQRFARQTKNPKTGTWCAPKYSIYYPILVMFIDEKGHVSSTALRMNSAEDEILKFKETHLENLDEFQKQQLKEIIAFNKVMENVTFKLERQPSFSLFSKDPSEIAKRDAHIKRCEEREKENKKAQENIFRAIAYETSRVSL